MKTHHAAIIAICSFVAACAGEPTDSQPTPSPADAPEASDTAEAASQPTEETTLDPVATLQKGGDFRFALEDSAVLADVRKKCESAPAEKSDSDTASPVEACMKRIAESAKGEGVAFEPLGEGRVKYVSYTHEDGKRVTLIEAELSLKEVEPGIVEFVDGKVITGPELPPGTRIFVEVVDENTIAMDKQPGAHPRTGSKRLVFHRLAQ
jgi:hypothetical protein